MGRGRSEGEAERPVLPWRLVVSALLHFVVPAYLLTLLAVWLIEGAPTQAMLGKTVTVSGRFLVGYALLTLLAALLAAALNPALTRRRARRTAENPALAARRSGQRVADALARAARLTSGAAGEPIRAAVVQPATFHNSFQDPEKFIAAAGGRRGRQLQVLVEGSYFINRLFATVEMVLQERRAETNADRAVAGAVGHPGTGGRADAREVQRL